MKKFLVIFVCITPLCVILSLSQPMYWEQICGAYAIGMATAAFRLNTNNCKK
nr:MAG TPA: hypothetical protein [Caudoviricetes sp.]